MKKICFNTRDELIMIDPEQIAYIEAEGNYSRVYYITNYKENDFRIPHGISKVEEILGKVGSTDCEFIRLGRGIIINRKYIFRINMYDKEIILSDFGINFRKLRGLPKPWLNSLKKLEIERIEQKQ